MRFARSRHGGLVESDMTPMIDMTFQLIAFFMVLMNFSEAEIDQRINLPASQLAKPPEGALESSLTFQLTSQGTVLVAGEETPLAGVVSIIRRERQLLERTDKNPADTTIIIRADGDADFGEVQQLIKECQTTGRFEKFALRAMQEERDGNEAQAFHRRAVEKVDMQMTPMIDIVFQLLIFFLLSFKIVPQEGDFDIKMPLAAEAAGMPTEPIQPILVRLTAAEDGSISGIRMGERALPSFEALHEEILAIVGVDRGPGSLADVTEVEIDADYNLHYSYAIAAIEAISGYVDAEGNIIRLIDKIKFAQPRAAP